MSILPDSRTSTEYACDDRLKKRTKNVDKVQMKSADVDNKADEMLKHFDTLFSNPLHSTEVRSEKVSDTQSGTSRQKDSFRVPDVSSALAADMVSLYRSKVLQKSDFCVLLSSSCSPSKIPASAGNSGVNNATRTSRTGKGVQMPDSSVMQLKRTVVTKPLLISKSPFKLVEAKSVLASTCRGEILSPPVPRSLQVATHSDKNAVAIPEQRTTYSTSTSCCVDSVPHATASTTRIVSSLPFMAKNAPVQITQAVSSNSRTVFTTSSRVPVSSCTKLIRGRNSYPNVGLTPSKYKLTRMRESVCRNAVTSKHPHVTSLKDTSVTPAVPRRIVKQTPTLLVVNKYKLVHKKHCSSTQLASSTPSHTKKLASSTRLRHDVSKPAVYINTSLLNSKVRSSRYKLVRKNVQHQQHSTPLKKPTAQLSIEADEKVQLLSKYKLVRRRSTVGMPFQTPQRATSTPTNGSQCIAHYTRNLCNRHVTPPLFLNKYKLIRKRALLKTNSGCNKNWSHYRMHPWKPSAEGYKNRYSEKQHAVAGMSSLCKKRRKRNRSFLSKYALQRSGKGSISSICNRISLFLLLTLLTFSFKCTSLDYFQILNFHVICIVKIGTRLMLCYCLFTSSGTSENSVSAVG